MSKSSPNTMRRAEIHSHSTASDGAYAPAEVARRCHEAGVELWALTDHDNCYGCAEAARAARSLGITFIPGIELSAYHTRSVHVLGYGVVPDADALEDYARRRVKSRVERMHKMIERLDGLGVQVSIEQVRDCADSEVLGRPHLARALLADGAVDTMEEAFDRYLANGGPAHVATKWPTVDDAIALIHRVGGIAVLAHPGQYGLDEAIPGWVEAGLDGVEVIHPRHGAGDRSRYEEIAASHGLLKTASSDFHGDRHGSKLGEVEFPADWLDAFLDELSVERPRA
jgi:3',5'-nucleoside bisphosphate phosphatase